MKRTLLLLLIFPIAQTLLAQQPPGACPGNMATLTSSCADACVLCDITGYTGTNSATDLGEAPPGFCAPQLHNTQWIGFVAGSANITFSMNVFNCQLSDGLQTGIYSTTDCTSYNLVSNCEPSMPENETFIFNANGLTPGGIYFFVIDGANGDICDFTINVVNGSAAAPTITGTPVITGPSAVCPGGTAGYSSTDIFGAGVYTWTFNGSPVGFDQNVSVTMPGTPGNYQLCVTPSNPCSPPGQMVCTTISVQPLPTEMLNETICVGEVFTYHGNSFSTPGVHNFSYVDASGCIQPVRLVLTVLQPTETFVEDERCADEVPYLVGIPGSPGATQLFSSTNGYLPVYLQNQFGCDSVVYVDLTVHPLQSSLDQQSICQGESYTVTDGFVSYTYTQTTYATLVLTSSTGCDSTVFLNLQVYPVPAPTQIVETICEGEYYEIGGFLFYNTTGIYGAVIESVGGCDSVIALNLTVLEPFHTELDISICEGESYTVGNSSFSSPGSYTVELVSEEYGCDSIVELSLSVSSGIETSFNAAICEGESYSYNGTNYTNPGSYPVNFTTASGCDSTVTLNLSVGATPETNLTRTVCAGGSVMVGNTTYSSSGTYQQVLNAAGGCDSTVNLNLTVLAPITRNLTREICAGETFTVGNQSFGTSGNYSVTLNSFAGCDSTVHLNLNVIEPVETMLDVSICAGQSYSVGNSTYNQSGSYTNTLTAESGCDSIVYLDLVVTGAIINNISRSICTGQTYTVGSSTYSSPGMYQDVLPSSAGCDSIVNLTLSIADVLEEFLTETICQGESFTVGSSTYSATGMYEDEFVTANGCDSVVYLNLTVNPALTTNLVETICEGESVTVGNSVYSTSGNFTNVLTAATGCDSTVHLNLTVDPFAETFLTETLCAGETYSVGNTTYNTSGIFTNSFTAANGCDSTVMLDLTVLPVPVTNLNETICEGETFTVGTSTYSDAGAYQDTLVAANGCDSIINLTLQVQGNSEYFVVETICEGEIYNFNGIDYSDAGAYDAQLISSNGCDSTVHLDLRIAPVRLTNISASICTGGSYMVGTSTYNTTGNYQDILTSAAGCDSIVNLSLTVTSFYEINLTESICAGESFTVGNSTYTNSGSYTDNFISSDGCDSIVNLELTVFPNVQTDLNIVLCEGDSVVVGNTAYTQTGFYTENLSTAAGCDSIVTLDLTVHPNSEINLTEAVCAGETVSVGTSVYTETGVYQDVLPTVNGCDSIVNLNLTVFPVPTTELTATICESETYTVGASTFTTTGLFTEVLTSSDGCDSIVNLNLTVNPILQTPLVANICEGESVSVGNSAYTETGTYTETFASITGCDSIVFLDLTVNPVYEIDLTAEICDGENFAVGTSIYTESGVYQDVLSTVTGCDSIVNLELTVHPIPVTNIVTAICEGSSYQVGNSTYAVSGQYTDVLTAFTGCDSIVNLNLTVDAIIETFLQGFICEGETFSVGSEVFSQTGNYQIGLTAMTGCDSIVYLDLTVNPVYLTELDEAICDDEVFVVGGNSFNQTGNYEINLLSAEGCDSTVLLSLTVYPCALEVSSATTPASCFDEADGSLRFSLLVGTPPYTYTWGLVGGSVETGAIGANNEQISLSGLPAGYYRIVITDANGIQQLLQLQVDQPGPLILTTEISDYLGFNISCAEGADGFINVTVAGGIPPYDFTWNNGSKERDLDGLLAGLYQLTVTDRNGCPVYAEASLLEPPVITATFSTVDPPCFGDTHGQISVDAVSGGVSPYLFSLADRPLTAASTFSNLEIGTYTVQVQDANGCQWEQAIDVDQPDELVVDLGPDITMQLGDSVRLQAMTSHAVAEYHWKGSSPVACAGDTSMTACDMPWVAPMISGSYQVTVIDANGCTSSDFVNVFVGRERQVFIPNVFSPNNDGTDDMFMIFGGADVARVKSFLLFNRWGETLFQLYDFQPNDPDNGWDGTHRSQSLNTGVYVYLAEIEFIDGETEIFKGDVLLMK